MSKDEELKPVNLPSSQWPEARGFTRLYAGNPHAQERLVQSLAGLFAIANEGWRPNTHESDGYMSNQDAATAIRGTLRYLREQFPEWASSDPVELDSDFFEEVYPGCDERTRDIIERMILEDDFDDGGVV